MKIRITETCTYCGGTGIDPYLPSIDCICCKGDGQIIRVITVISFQIEED